VKRPPDLQVGSSTALVVTTPAGLEGEARRELRDLLPGAQARSLFLKGNILVLTDVAEGEALARIAAAETRFLAQVVAVQRTLRVASDETRFPDIAAAAADVGRLGRGETFLVRCRRRGRHGWQSQDLERAVAHRIEELTGAVGDYDAEADWLVTVQVYQDIAYVGVERPAHVVQKTPRRQRKYAPGERPLNRAQWKMREGLQAFDIELPRGARVLDLGAAPGGWALVLAELAEEVVAVDPGDLDPTAAALHKIRHLRCKAEELPGRADLGGQFDLLTCDMNRDPSEVAAILCRIAPILKPGAPAMMTVKYVTQRRRQHERAVRSILSAEYEEIQLRRLPHNARETTAAMRRRGPGGPAAEEQK
jgi:tRNA(Ser,Leu) C12 N-acetylase TAN1